MEKLRFVPPEVKKPKRVVMRALGGGENAAHQTLTVREMPAVNIKEGGTEVQRSKTPVRTFEAVDLEADARAAKGMVRSAPAERMYNFNADESAGRAVDKPTTI